MSAPPVVTLDSLERHRDRTFRRLLNRRVTSDRAALAFINEVGFGTAFTAGIGVPCLREAIEGMREPPLPEHIQHDRAIMMTWNLKDTLAAKRLAYYGKVLGGRPSFIALDLLGAFLRLRVAPGGHRALFERGMLSQCARLVMDALARQGPADTKTLKRLSGYAQPRMRPAFDNAMRELQAHFLAVKIEERYDPFTYVWDTVARQWPEAIRESRALSPTAAAYRIVRRHIEVAGFCTERSAARVLGVEPRFVAGAIRRLVRERRAVSGVRLDRISGQHAVLTELLG